MHYRALPGKPGNFMMKKIICTLLATCFIGAANATPLTMSFDTTDLGVIYQYDFMLNVPEPYIKLPVDKLMFYSHFRNKSGIHTTATSF